MTATLEKATVNGEERSVHGVKDVTKPGDPGTRTAEVRSIMEHGHAPLIWNPDMNKGTAFTAEERKEKGLEGLLPPIVETIELQAERVMLQLRNDCGTDLARYVLLYQLGTHNRALLYYVLINNLEELAPIVYTPIVGEACQKFDRIYRSAMGMFFDAFAQRGHFRKMLDNWPSHNVQIIVVSDGSRILGLGDLGVNGMGIPLGKIQLYVAGGGFHPEHSLPAIIDSGTNTKDNIEDKFYFGNKKPRLSQEESVAAVEEFCMAVHDKWPNCLVQFEDFETSLAFAILEKMRNRLLCFNDDIQGTGAVVTTGFLNGMKAQGTPLGEAKVVFYGAGSSAVGVASMIARLIELDAKISAEDARKAIFMVDSKGLITTSRGDKLPSHKQQMARRDDTPNMKDLREIIEYVKPHALIGLSGAGPMFKQDAIEELCHHVEKPLVFPLSNPTDKAEITAEHAYEWTHGQAIFASGSPFKPYEYEGNMLVPGQANNVLIFPGVGFGAVMSKAKKVTDEMMLAAARALADFVSPEDIKRGKLYPDIKDLRAVSAVVATKVAEEALSQGLGSMEAPSEGLHKFITDRMWDPRKPSLNLSRTVGL
ncbi:hypothetical protein WJX81_000859 [Elliptochloris bilobata]|uniref:Malic enzyme n=1 Tax=Elliptochloris bilobata TaxID=381761 RepID=A0AAW1S7N4_9CHLO